MAAKPYTAKVIAQEIITEITDEEKRQRLIIGIIITIVIFLFIIMIPLFALTSNNYASTEITQDLEYYGKLPMPVQNAVVTCEFGARIHPITKKHSFHTGIDLAGTWHSNIYSIEKGTVVFAGVKRGYGNCVEVEHTTENGTTYFTFYAHLARIDVWENQKIEQGTVVGIQGGDPNRDPNPRI